MGSDGDRHFEGVLGFSGKVHFFPIFKFPSNVSKPVHLHASASILQSSTYFSIVVPISGKVSETFARLLDFP